MQQAHPDRLDAASAEELRRGADAVFVSGRNSSPRKLSRPPTSHTSRSGTMRSGFTQKYELP
jgi:hypothetical protein